MAKSSARVPLVERADLPPAEVATYDHVAQSRGAAKMPNVFKAIANNPAVLEKMAALGEFLRFQAKLDPMLRELAILTTAQESRSVYEWTAHWAIAQKLGAPAALLNMLGTPQVEREPAPTGIVLRFARVVARNEPVDDATFDAVKSHLGNAGIVELIALVGYYGALGRMLNVLRVPLDEGVEAKPFVLSQSR
jgi:4-carboxymuconolactone decarboxylase